MHAKYIAISITVVISLLLFTIFFKSFVYPLIKIKNIHINDMLNTIKEHSVFLKKQNTDIISNSIIPIIVILSGVISINKSDAMLANITTIIALIIFLASIWIIYIRHMINRLIEQIEFNKQEIIGEKNIKERIILIRIIYVILQRKVDVAGNILVFSIFIFFCIVLNIEIYITKFMQ